MTFTLWDTDIGNQFGQFEDERAALILVRTLVSHYGESYADDLGLGRVSDEGQVLPPLSGAALIARADEVLGHCDHDDQRRGEVITSRLAAVGRNLAKRADDLFGSSRIGRTVHASGQQRRH